MHIGANGAWCGLKNHIQKQDKSTLQSLHHWNVHGHRVMAPFANEAKMNDQILVCLADLAGKKS